MSRIRTTEQARLIRRGIKLARDNTPWNHVIDYAPKLVQTAYRRTRNAPPPGLDGEMREGHPGRKEWFSIYDPETAEAHVMPISDDIPHIESAECICGPTPEHIERPNGDAWLHTHHSLDGREHTEPDRRKA